MKKLILLLGIHFILFIANAQVKIGAPGVPDINAVLELAGSSKGLLLPRLALTGTSSASPLSAHVAGMVIYNTANVSDVRPGYYYNDGIHWIRIASSLDNWSLTGNAATNPVSQFIGTSDAIDLSIRTNNLERIKIGSAGNIEIGTSSLPATMRIRVGGTASGQFAALLGLDGNISSTADGQTLYSFFNAPFFSDNFNPVQVYGSYTDLFYTGKVSNFLAAEVGSTTTFGPNSYPGLAIGVRGNASRSSTGNDGNFVGGYFSAETLNPATGNLFSLFGVVSNATLGGTGVTALTEMGGQNNSVNIANPNGTVATIYGTRNILNHNAAVTISNAYAISNIIAANSGAMYTQAYGSHTNFQTSSGSITNAFGNYVGAIGASTNITNYRGIYVGNIGLTSGTRRAFEYAGIGTNAPVIINYDGSVQIGTNTPVTNARLSIVDGHLQSGQATKPTILANANMGTDATASLSDATDIAGTIVLDFGSGFWGPGVQATITFNRIYANPPIVIITPVNTAAAVGIVNQVPYISTSTSSFSINFGLPAASGNVMMFNYHVIETVNN